MTYAFTLVRPALFECHELRRTESTFKPLTSSLRINDKLLLKPAFLEVIPDRHKL